METVICLHGCMRWPRQWTVEEEKSILWNAYRKQEKGRRFEEQGKGSIGDRERSGGQEDPDSVGDSDGSRKVKME